MKTIDPDIISAINPVVVKYPGIIRIGIFGSYARNEIEKNDVDIVYEEYPKYSVIDMLNFQADLRNSISEKIHKDSDILTYKSIIAETDDEDDEYIKQNILKDIVWVYEKE